MKLLVLGILPTPNEYPMKYPTTYILYLDAWHDSNQHMASTTLK